MDADGRADLHRWFLPQLAEAWDDGSNGVGQADDDRYVQWAGDPLGLQIECVSNRFLTGDARLSPEEVDRLRRLGWHDPLGEDLPNFWQTFVDRDDLPTAADALVDAVGVLRGEALAGPPDTEVRPVRTVVVVPVMKVDHETVLTAVTAGLTLLPEAVVVDLLAEGPDEVPPLPATSVTAVLGAGPYLDYPLLADPGVSFPSGPAAEAMTAAGQVLAKLQQLRAAGRSVVLIGPRLLPGDEWLYAAALHEAADAVVFCVSGADDGPLGSELLTAVLPAVQRIPRVVSVATPRLPGALLPALGAVDAVVAGGGPQLSRDSLVTLLGAGWQTPDQVAPRGRLLDAVVRARLLPLSGRLRMLPEALHTGRDVDAAVDLLSAVMAVVRRHLAYERVAGLAWSDILTELCARLADAGRRGVPGVQRAVAPLEWLAARGGDHAAAARDALARVATDDTARPTADRREPKLLRVPDGGARRPGGNHVPAGTQCTGKTEFAALRGPGWRIRSMPRWSVRRRPTAAPPSSGYGSGDANST